MAAAPGKALDKLFESNREAADHTTAEADSGPLHGSPAWLFSGFVAALLVSALFYWNSLGVQPLRKCSTTADLAERPSGACATASTAAACGATKTETTGRGRGGGCGWDGAGATCVHRRVPPLERGAPLMGWSPWNAFHRNWTETLFLQSAEVLSQSGMRAAGYDSVFMDGGWWDGVDSGTATRNKSGFIVEDRSRLPGGVGRLAAALRARGYNYGHYTNAGRRACNGDKGFAYGHEEADASLFASWGVDYLKIDSCGLGFVPKGKLSRVVLTWQRALDKAGPAGRRVLINNCRVGCLSNAGVGVVNGDDGGICREFPVPRRVEPWCTAEDSPQARPLVNWRTCYKNEDFFLLRKICTKQIHRNPEKSQHDCLRF